MIDVAETPIRPLDQTCGICGVDDEVMELEAEESEKIVMGEEALRIGRDDGVRGFRKLVDPLKPNKEEVDDHDLFHTPYRNWCPICVRAKGKTLDHQKKTEINPAGYSEYSFDYGFPGDEFGFKLTVLRGKERRTGMRFATAVPTKGASGRFSSDKALQFMEEILRQD